MSSISTGNSNEAIPTKEITQRIGIDYDGEEASQITRYLKNEDLIGWTSFERVWITHKGIKEVEKAHSEPIKSTHPSSVIINNNKLTVEQMNYSQIQQGTVKSKQNLTQTKNHLDSLNKFVELFEQKIEELPFESSDSQMEFIAEFQTLKCQLSSPNPKNIVVQETVKTMKNMLEKMNTNVLRDDMLKHLLKSWN